MIGVSFIVVAIIFGGLMGWGLTRSPDDRSVVGGITAVCAAAGALAWLIGDPDTMPHTAGVAMTLGCGTAVAVIVVSGRRSIA